MRRALGPLFAVALCLQENGAVEPPSSAVLESVPPISRTIADGMNRFADYRTAHLAAWHPKRREMLIATRFACRE